MKKLRVFGIFLAIALISLSASAAYTSAEVTVTNVVVYAQSSTGRVDIRFSAQVTDCATNNKWVSFDNSYVPSADMREGIRSSAVAALLSGRKVVVTTESGGTCFNSKGKLEHFQLGENP